MAYVHEENLVPCVHAFPPEMEYQADFGLLRGHWLDDGECFREAARELEEGLYIPPGHAVPGGWQVDLDAEEYYRRYEGPGRDPGDCLKADRKDCGLHKSDRAYRA